MQEIPLPHAVVAGLIAVRIGPIYYAGVLNEQGTARARKQYGRDFVCLDKAVEILLRHRPTETGIQVSLLPTWIAPYDTPVAKFVTRVDSILDLTKAADPGFHALMRNLMGDTGVLLPSAPSRIRLPS